MWLAFDRLDAGAEEDAHGADPGKDLFALLALVFLVLSVLFMLAAQLPEARLAVELAQRSAAPVPAAPAAVMRGGRSGAQVTQGGHTWVLPAQAARVASEAALGRVPGQRPVLLVDPPGAELSARQLVRAVQALNGAGVQVRFRAVPGEGGGDE